MMDGKLNIAPSSPDVSRDPSGTAAELVGQVDPKGDWLLEPQTHAKRLPEEADALARILVRSEIINISLSYQRADAAALVAQRRYKHLNLLAIGLRFLAIGFGIWLAVPASLKSHFPVGWDVAVDRWVVALQFMVLTAALVLGITIEKRRLFRRWMTFRARAEQIRRDYFDAVLAAQASSADTDPLLLPLKLEYFTRYHLVAQREYYSRRGAEHRRKAWQTRRAMGWVKLVGILSMLPVLWVMFDAVGLVPFDTRHVNGYFLTLGTVAAVILGALDAISKANLDARNAARYGVVTENLQFLEENELPVARRAAASGKCADVRGFLERVNREISLEHREWRFLRDEFQRQASNRAPQEDQR